MISVERLQLSGLPPSSMSVSHHPLLDFQVAENPLKLFSEKNQCQLAHALGSLLAPESGSIIFGSHLALPNKGVFTEKIFDMEGKIFCHDPVSWKDMWVGRPITENTTGVDPADNVGNLHAAVFPLDSVKLDSTLIPVKSGASESRIWFLVWSITRVYDMVS
jgi:hypothetical protein